MQLNYAQKSLLALSLFSSLIISVLWLTIGRVGDFTTRELAIICALSLLVMAVQAFVALVLGNHVAKKLIVESSVAQKLRDLEGSISSRERERKQEQDNLVEAIIIVDENNRVISLNRAAKKLIGSMDEIRDHSLAEIIREPAVHDLVQSAKEQKIDLATKFRFGATNAIVVHARATPLLDGKLMLSLLDVSQLHAHDSGHDNFIAHASHELKTPVAIILANAELLLDSPQDAKDHPELLHAIHRQALRAKNLLESLLGLVHLNIGNYDVKPEPIDLHQFVSELKHSLGHVGVMIENDVAHGVRLITDRALFERLSHIIVENAHKYAGSDANLKVSAAKHGDYLKINFVDNGPGIKNHLRERVFEQFYRQPEHENSEKEGFGLGLSHARAIATSLGGKIFVDNSKNQGCAIAVMLDA